MISFAIIAKLICVFVFAYAKIRFSHKEANGLEKLCTGEPLRRPKPAQDKWYVIMSGHPFIKALAAYWGGAFV